MWRAMLMMTQADPVAALDLRAAVADRDGDCNCERGAAATDIVICGRRESPYRLTPLPVVDDRPGVPPAEISVGATTAAIDAEQVEIGSSA